MAAPISITYIRTRASHSFLFSVHCRAASTVFILIPKGTIISVCPSLALHLLPITTHFSHTVPIHSLHVSKASPLADSLYPPTLFIFQLFYEPLDSFLSLTIKHFRSSTFTLLLSALLITHVTSSYNEVFAQLLLHTDYFHIYTQSYIA